MVLFLDPCAGQWRNSYLQQKPRKQHIQVSRHHCEDAKGEYHPAPKPFAFFFIVHLLCYSRLVRLPGHMQLPYFCSKIVNRAKPQDTKATPHRGPCPHCLQLGVSPFEERYLLPAPCCLHHSPPSMCILGVAVLH